MARKQDLDALETAVGHRFENPDLLRRALTHSSANNGKSGSRDNERLEFLGDRVLGLATAEHLAERYPAANEGELARQFNRLVRREACARVGRSIDIGRYLLLSESRESSGGRKKATILADAVEALLAAVFLDAGFTKAREVVRNLWAEFEEEVPVEGVVDAKSALQEWAQGCGLELPKYKVVARKGPDHAPHFTTEVRLSNGTAAAGEGTSKRASEQAAAMAALVHEGVWNNAD